MFFLSELDGTDPGRSSLRGEWCGPGDVVFEEQTDSSGLVRVYSAPSSSGGSWRRLRFNDCTEQSVVLLDASGDPVRSALPFGYLKSLAAVGVCTSHALGRTDPLRVLVVGVGGGALPAWFSTQFGAVVDAVELDDAVLRAATTAMGLPEHVVHKTAGADACVQDATMRKCDQSSLAVYCCDGAEFICAAARTGGVHYDCAIIDVFDGEGKTPAAFVGREVGDALGQISSCAVANLTCPVPMWEDAHEYNSPQAADLVRSWRAGFGPQSGVWSVRVPEGQNIIPAVTSVGIPPSEFLRKEAEEAANEGAFAFDPVKRVDFRHRDWL